MGQVQFDAIIDLIAEISLGSAVLVVYAQLAGWRARLTPRKNLALTGAVFGVAGVLAQLVPVRVAPDLPISTVTACVGLAGLFGGWIGGAIAVALSTLARLAVDQPQLFVGTLRAALAMIVGIAVAERAHRLGRPVSLRDLIVQGALVLIAAAFGNAALLTRQPALLAAATVPLAVVLPLSTVLLGMQFRVEIRREELERKVRQSEAALSDIVGNLPGAVLQVRQEDDGSLSYPFVSEGSLATLHIAPEELMRNPAAMQQAVLLEEEEEQRQRYLRETAATLAPSIREYRIRRPDGGTDWVRTRATPRRDAQGRMTWTTFISNISEEKRKDNELRRFTAELGESERRLRAIVASIPGIVYQARQSTDGGIRYTFVSEGVRELGFSPAKALADPSLMARSFVPADEAAPSPSLPEPGGRLRVYERDFRVQRPDGSLRWMHSRSVPHAMNDGSVVWDGITLDITDRKRLEETMERSERVLVLGALTGGVAHAFDALLREVKDRAERVRGTLPAGSGHQSDVEEITRQADLGERFREALSSFSRRPADLAETRDLHALFAELRELSTRFAGKAIRLTLRTPPGLWSPEVDALRLQQALFSLILNARDAVPEGGEIVISARNGLLDEGEAAAIGRLAGPYVRISVADNGPGMDDDVRAHALDPLFTTKAPGSGSGMPLSMVQAFVQRAGGHLSLHSAPGKGTEVRLLLPAKPAPEPRPTAMAAAGLN